jgi:membrane protein
MILTRLLGIVLVLGVGFLLVVAVVANIVVGSLGAWLGAGGLVPYLNAIVSLFLIAASFACLYKLLPDASVAWRAAWLGAGVAAVAEVVALSAVNLYFSYVRLNTALSVAGGLAVLLMLTNYLAQVFLFGAVVTRHYRQTADRPSA